MYAVPPYLFLIYVCIVLLTVDSTCIFTFFLLFPSDYWINILRKIISDISLEVYTRRGEGKNNCNWKKISTLNPVSFALLQFIFKFFAFSPFLFGLIFFLCCINNKSLVETSNILHLKNKNSAIGQGIILRSYGIWKKIFRSFTNGV